MRGHESHTAAYFDDVAETVAAAVDQDIDWKHHKRHNLTTDDDYWKKKRMASDDDATECDEVDASILKRGLMFLSGLDYSRASRWVS